MFSWFKKIKEWVDGIFVDEYYEPSPPEKVYYVNVYIDTTTGEYIKGLKQPTLERAKMQAEKLKGTGLVLYRTQVYFKEIAE